MDPTGGMPPGGGDSPGAPEPEEITPASDSCPHDYQAGRDALADERDRVADVREALANDREALAYKREREADDREQSLDELARILAASIASLEEGAPEQSDRSRADLAAQMQRLERQEATAMRERARRMRKENAIVRAAAAADEWTLPAAGSGDPRQEVAALTQMARHILGAFARTAEEIARRHDNAAAASTGPGDEHQRKAERAREAVRRSAEIMRDFPA